jgi:hypothetical protein
MNGIFQLEAYFLFMRSLTGRKRTRAKQASCFFQSPFVVFGLACGQQSATNYRSFAVFLSQIRITMMTHHSAVL